MAHCFWQISLLYGAVSVIVDTSTDWEENAGVKIGLDDKECDCENAILNIMFRNGVLV